MTVIALGSINVDFQMTVDQWPQPGGAMHGRDFTVAGGGKAANVALFACRANVPAILLGQVGDDWLAKIALKNLESACANLSFVRHSRSGTGAAFVITGPHADKIITMAGNANMDWDEQAIAAAVSAVNSAGEGSVLVADLEVPPGVVEATARAARDRGLKVVIDPSPAECMTPALYELADVLTPNPSEARHLSGVEVEDREAATRAAESIRMKAGGAAVFVKLQHGDCLVLADERATYLRALPIKAVDTTGAGDAFAAATAIGLGDARPIAECALLGMAGASIAVRSYGAQASYKDRAALDTCFRELMRRNPMR